MNTTIETIILEGIYNQEGAKADPYAWSFSTGKSGLDYKR